MLCATACHHRFFQWCNLWCQWDWIHVYINHPHPARKEPNVMPTWPTLGNIGWTCKLGNLLVIGLIIPYEKRIVHPKIWQICSFDIERGWYIMLWTFCDACYVPLQWARGLSACVLKCCLPHFKTIVSFTVFHEQKLYTTGNQPWYTTNAKKRKSFRHRNSQLLISYGGTCE